jgi:hypothetical protein
VLDLLCLLARLGAVLERQVPATGKPLDRGQVEQDE